MEYCNNNNIKLFYFPSHATDHLQPLDVGVFSPLDRYCREGQDDFVRLHPPYTPIHKADFIRICEQARTKALTHHNITNAWLKCGAWPVNKQRILKNPDIQFAAHHRKLDPRLRSPFKQPIKNIVSYSECDSEMATASVDECRALVEWQKAAQSAQARATLLEQEVRELRAAPKASKSDRKVATRARVVSGRMIKPARSAKDTLADKLEKGKKKGKGKSKKVVKKGKVNADEFTIRATDEELERQVDELMRGDRGVSPSTEEGGAQEDPRSHKSAGIL